MVCWLRSLDRGRSWSSFGELPTAAVDDILIEPKTHSIVTSRTQGRSLYVSWIGRGRSAGAAGNIQIEVADTVHVFAPDTAIESQPLPSYDEWTGRGQFRGENPPAGGLLSYYLSQATGDSVAIAITTKRGRASRRGPCDVGAAMAGLNRVAWDLQPTRGCAGVLRGGSGG